MAESTTGAPRGAASPGGAGVPGTAAKPSSAAGNGGAQSGATVNAGAKPGVVPAAPKAPPPPPFLIHSVGEYGRYLKLLAYGDYGTGKTRLVGSSAIVPQMQDVMFIDCEAGDLTIATEDDPSYNKAVHEHMVVVRARTFKEMARIQEFLKLHCQYRDKGDEATLKKLEQRIMSPDEFDPDAPARRFRTAIIDSLSEAESFSMYQLLGITDMTRLDEEVASPEWAEYKRNHSQILRMIRSYRDLPMHILMTAASTYTQDDQKRMLFTPAMTGKLSKQCQAFMDVVGYMFVASGEEGKKIHVLQVQPSPRINAKCRFSNFKGSGWNDPTMHSILSSVGLLDKGLKQVSKA